MNTFHTYTFPEAKNIIICGDIHGEFNSLIYKLCIQYQLTDTLLIVAGDCGFGFEARILRECFQEKLGKTQQGKQLDCDGSRQSRRPFILQ